MEKKILLQLFAEEIESETTPTEEVENSNDELEENEDDVNFDGEDNDKEVEQKKEATSKKQRQNNYNNAQARIQRKHEEELKKAQRESYVKGVVESNNGVNHYTGGKIQDEIDVKQLELLNEMKNKGLDTDDLGEVLKFMAEKERQANKEKQLEQEKQNQLNEKINNDMQEFINEYGEDKLEELLDEEGEFSKSKYRNLIGKVSLKEAYELFEDHKKDIDKKASSLAKQKDARRKASSGNFGNGETSEISYENMTKEQRKAYRDSIRSR